MRSMNYSKLYRRWQGETVGSVEAGISHTELSNCDEAFNFLANPEPERQKG